MEQLYTTPNQTIGQLLDKIETGELALPELQRPLVWKSTQVRDLFDSILKGYPIGYVMLWECQDYNKIKKIGKSEKEYSSPKQVIIDGQQRLTTLYSVIKNKSVIMKDYSDKKFCISYNPLTNKFEVKNNITETDAEWIDDITKIFTEKSIIKFYKDYMAELIKMREKKKLELSEEDKVRIENSITEIYAIKDRPIMIYDISSKADEEDVAEIFVRVNYGGVKLNQNDFILTLVSLNWEEGRRNIEKFCESSTRPPQKNEKNSAYNLITEVEAQYVIRVVMAYAFYRGSLKYGYKLLRGADFDKKGLISNEKKNERFRVLKQKLPKVIDSNSWHEFLKSIISAGYVSGSLILSKNTIFYCYAFYLIGKYKFKISANENMHLMALWFYFSALVSLYTGSFESEVETELNVIKDLKNAKQFKAYFLNRINERMTNDYFNTTLVGTGELFSRGNKGNNAYNAFVASLIILGSKVLFSKTNMQLSKLFDINLNGNRSSLELHHLFPKQYLKNKGYTDKMINQMANYSYIDWKDNGEISDDDPKKYYKVVCSGKTKKEVEKMEEENALPHGWQNMKYEDFLVERRKLMSQKIKQAFDKLKRNVE